MLSGGEVLYGITMPPVDRSRYEKMPHYTDNIEQYAKERHISLRSNPEHAWYYEMRGVKEMIKTAKLGWDFGWAVLPVRNETGKTEGIICRAYPHVQQETNLRFHMPDGQPSMMYCPDWSLMQKRSRVAIVFGMFDALAVASLGWPVLSPTAGQESFDPKWLDDQRRLFVIIPDDGEYTAANDLAVALNWRAFVYHIDYPEKVKDPAGFLEEDRKDDLAEILEGVLGMSESDQSLLSLPG
jgi:hypothetical protein